MQNPDSYTFTEHLTMKLELESDGKKGTIYASNIENFELELHSYGFDGWIGFTGYENEDIEEVFNSSKPIDVTFAYKTRECEEPTSIKGVVVERFSRGIERNEKEACMFQMKFSDGAKESWSNHFPKAIHIEKTMKDVIDKEKNPLVNIEYDWEVLTEEHPILAYSLHDDHHLAKKEKVSFYSFLTWYLQQEGGVLEYNYKENKYKILGEKSSEGDPKAVAQFWVTTPWLSHPISPKWVNRNIKHFPDRMEEESESNEDGYPSVQKDNYDNSTYAQFPEQNKERVKSPIQNEKAEIVFRVKEFDEKFQFVDLFPGNCIIFKGREALELQWSDHSYYKDKEFRIRKTRIVGQSQQLPFGVEVETMPFECGIEVTAEYKEEVFIPRPDYNYPQFPFTTLGEIFCDLGGEEQTTFNVTKDENMPLGRYQVKIPLSGEEDKYVIVPFSPDFMTGQHYFPFCKEQQVMLDMEFKTAKIKRVVNWQPLTELPEKTQGCQIVFASEGPNKYLFQKHEYEDGKDSVMTIKQSSSERQTQVITIKEKEIKVVVEEQDKRVTTIQLNRDEGLLIEVEDQDSGITNSTLYDDQSITHTSKGSSGTSTIVQKPDSVEITADKVTTNCEEFFVDAKKIVTLKAASKVFLDTPLVTNPEDMNVGMS